MNVSDVIRELNERKRRIERTIAAIEAIWELIPETAARTRRGRKTMAEDERREVSARMKAYWAAWRRDRSRPASGERTVEAAKAAAAGAGHGSGEARH